MREWGEIDRQIGSKEDEAIDLMVKKGHAMLGIAGGTLSVLVGIGLASNPDTRDIVCGSAAVVAGIALIAKASLDQIYILPTRIKELSDQIGITPDEMDTWYVVEYDNME